MKNLRKTLSLIMIIIINILSAGNYQCNAYPVINNNSVNPINVGVFIYELDDPYFSMIRQSLEDIQKENGNKIKFTYFDAKGNQLTQNESIDNSLKDNFDVLIINLVDQNLNKIQGILDRIIEKNVPMIIYADPNRELLNYVKNYKKVIFVASDIKQSGELQGKILIDLWNANKESVDKNKDNKLQYIIFHGDVDSPEAVSRTKEVIEALNEAGIQTEELALEFCDWKEQCAENAIQLLYFKFGNKIEAIISNNDAMAIGAIKGLQKYGYNIDDKSKYIPVVGVDGITEAKDLIKKGLMTGTVVQDPRRRAEIFYDAALNMALGNPPLLNTNYKFDETGIIVRSPYYEYTSASAISSSF